MVRRMKLTGRTGLWAIGLLVAVAAAAVLGSHRFTPTRKPMGARCPQDPRVALACYEERYRSIVAAQGVAEAFALTLGREKLLSDLDAVCAAVPGKQRKSLDYFNCVHGLGHAIMAVRTDELFDALHDCDGLTGS